MRKSRIKYYLDFIPVLILIFYSVKLILYLRATTIQIEWINIFGLILLPITIALLIWKHQVGILALGLLLFLGLFGAISFNPGISTYGMGLGVGDNKASFELYGEPIYLVFLVIHFVLSGRYYVGILTRQYWQNLASDFNGSKSS